MSETIDPTQAKVAATNYVLIPEPLMTLFLLGLWFGANQSIFRNFSSIANVSSWKRVRSSMDEEGQDRAAMVVRS
jgi:hypothetical protein